MFAKAKRAEEHKPWAIIIVKDASQPQVVADINPAITSPICPTEE